MVTLMGQPPCAPSCVDDLPPLPGARAIPWRAWAGTPQKQVVADRLSDILDW